MAGAKAIRLQQRVEVSRDRKPEHAVPEEGQALVRVAAALPPRGVRKDLPVEIGRKSVEE